MAAQERLDDNTEIYRRIPAHPNNTILRDGVLTATFFALHPRREGEYPSWSTTVPIKLIGIEKNRGRDMSGWNVAEVAVSVVRDLGLDVVPDPTEDDPGHCHIVPTGEQPFTKMIWSKLAKKTRVVYTVPDSEKK